MQDVGIEAIEAWTPEEVAQRLRCDHQSVRRAYYAGKLEGVKIGHLLRFTPAAVAKYLASLAAPATGEAGS